jgi:hypothetical protein
MVQKPKSDAQTPGKKQEQAETRTQIDSARDLPASFSKSEKPGAPLSNTAPSNSIVSKSAILRTGVDSLYLSFSGTLREHIEKQLIECKEWAQSDDFDERSKAIFEIQDSQFEVLPRGAPRFPYILRDGMFNIRLSSRESEKMPLAAAQVRSRGLTESGMEPAVEYLEFLLREIGQVQEIKVSRIDLCCDFTSDIGFGTLPELAWISRSNKRNWYTESGNFTGFVFGQGSPMSARLYDKTRQIIKSKQDYMRDLWWMLGWEREQTVWRLEFQIKRPVLVELGIHSYNDIRQQLDSLWQYATSNWLRLVTPGEDKTRSRWPNHPLWDELQSADFGTESTVPLSRHQFRRVPLDRYFFINGLAPITSYMASHGISTFKEAGPRFLKDAEEFHAMRSVITDEDIEEYCQKRAAIKAKEYCTRFPYSEVKHDPDFENGKKKEKKKEKGK